MPLANHPVCARKRGKRDTTMTTIELTAPSHWAPYLIHGDASGLSLEDEQACENWLRAMNLHNADCVDCIDAGFCHSHDASEFTLAADCQTYTFMLS